MKNTDIPVTLPCHEDWGAMRLVDAKKKFCGSCKKHVHDLSKMSRSEAKALLAAPATDGLCVRYLHDQHGAVVFADTVAPSMLTRFKRAAMLAAPLTLTACMGAANAPPPPPPPSPVAVAPTAAPSPPTTATSVATDPPSTPIAK